MGSASTPAPLRPLAAPNADFAEGTCDDPTCIKAGVFKVSCYLCMKVYHSGCAGLPDSDYKIFRCCESVPGPDGFRRVSNPNKVKCTTCKRKFFKLYARMNNYGTFTCVPCIMSGKVPDDEECAAPDLDEDESPEPTDQEEEKMI